MLTIWWWPCVESSLVSLEEGVMTSAFSWKNSITLCPASFCTPYLPVTPGVSWLATFAFQSPIMKRASFGGVSSRISSVAQLWLTHCDPMNHSMPGLPVHHQLPEFTPTHVHQVCDAIQPSHLLLSPSPSAPNPSQHQGLFQWVSSSHEVDEVLEFQLQHQSFQWIPRDDLL